LIPGHQGGFQCDSLVSGHFSWLSLTLSFYNPCMYPKRQDETGKIKVKPE
jgi:hypothetical protein